MAPEAPVASTLASPGRLRTGSVVSSTVTVNEPVVLLPESSTAVHVTNVAPRGNLRPDAGEQATVGDGSTTSEAVASGGSTFAPPVVLPSVVKLAGTVMTGGVESTTVT